MLRKLLSNSILFAMLGVVPLIANIDQLETNQLTSCRGSHHCSHRKHSRNFAAYGKLSASSSIDNLVIENPQSSIPPTTGWQPFPVDTFSTSLNTFSPDPSSATILVPKAGTYLLNALLTVAYPDPGSNGPDDLTNYSIGVIINNVLQNDAIGSFHISTEANKENPGLLFSASLSDLVTLPEESTVQFVIAAGAGSASPFFLNVSSANASIVRVGN